MKYAGSLSGEAANLRRKFKIGATVAAGQPVIKDTGNIAEVTDPTKTAAADAYGVTLEAATYSATQGDTEGVVDTVYAPLAIFESNVAGGTNDTEGTALTITESDAADTAGTSVDDSDLPSDSMPGGMIYGLTGANVGQSRVILSFISADSIVITVPFLNDIASGDQFLVFGAKRGSFALTLTTLFTQASQYFATGSGIPVVVVDILIDDTDKAAPTAKYHFILRDHVFNPLS